MSRGTVGDVGLKMARLRSRWAALPLDTSDKSDGGVEDEGDGQHRLVVAASLSRDSADALVSPVVLSGLAVFNRIGRACSGGLGRRYAPEKPSLIRY
jgi:hypothetical protein